ncbi:MFS transporter [Cryobacterium sp. Y62]|uniref:MFS transporter n=1 Tax=Cryobacterium sp. Y62 TaxID=2048284 RepID=UPI000CE5270E|nr:MFS transporter [Cryobacterium sp. Y62]
MTSVSTPPTHRKLRQVALAVGIGNFLEWYDFAVYGVLAVTIGSLFFAGDDPVVSTLSALGVFAVGFLFRPLGAVILGIVGDNLGRRAALVISIIGMGVATVLIGFLPTYSEVGVLAPVLLIVIRALQGLSAGGEWTGSATYLIEGAPVGSRARYGSVISATGSLATAFGSFFVLTLNTIYTTEQMLAFGWRIPFWVAGILVVVGLFIRLRMDESPVFAEIQKQKRIVKNPLISGLRRNWKAAVLTLAFGTMHGVGYYYISTYTVNYLQVTVGLPPRSALLITGCGLLFHSGFCFFAGWVVDKVGRRRPNVLAALGFVIVPIPAFALMGTGNMLLVIIGFLLLIVIHAFASVTCVVLLVELFPAETRSSSSAVAFNFAVAFIAGPAPYIAGWLAATLQSPIAPAFYLVGLAVIAVIVLGKMLPESKGWNLFLDRPTWDTHKPVVEEPTAIATSR